MAKIVYEKGNPFIDIDGKRFEPAAFRSFRPRPDNVSLAYRAGVRLFQVLVSGLPCTLEVPYSMYGGVWKGEGEYDFSAFDRQMEMFMRFAPEGYFNVMMQLDVCPWFAKEHPGEDTDSYRHITELALNEDWKRAAAAYMKALIAYAEEKYGDRVWAYSIAAGSSNEWFDSSLADKSFDREHTRLTKLWREAIRKPDAPVPTRESLDAGSGLRAPDSDDFRYLELATKQTSELICYFAAEAQKELRHRKLFGLFYGYALTAGWQVYWNTNGYEQVWRSPDIDMLYAPAAYRDNRFLEGVSSYQYTVDSIRLNGKLYLHENDHRTELARFPLENGKVLTDCYDNFSDWREVFRRELCNVMQKQAAFWWFDFFGGYYSAPEYEEELRLEMQLFRALAQGERHSVAEIAVFLDPMSYLCTREHTCLAHDESIRTVNELLRCGAPFELFNLSDLPRLDVNRYKLFIFPNALLLTEETRAFIRNRLKGRMKVFAHADGMWNGREFSLESASDLCGMTLAARKSASSDSRYLGIKYSFEQRIQPLMQVEDPDAQPLALFEDGAVSCARKGENVYTCVPELPWQLLRDLAKAAGVHIYSEQGSGTAICSQFVCAYTTLTEDCELHMPEDGRYRELFHGETYECRGGLLTYHAPRGTTMLFVKEA